MLGEIVGMPNSAGISVSDARRNSSCIFVSDAWLNSAGISVSDARLHSADICVSDARLNNNNTGHLLHAISPKSKEHIACCKHNKLQIHCCETLLQLQNIGKTLQKTPPQSITFEASDRSRSLPLALIHILASELSLAPIREIAR